MISCKVGSHILLEELDFGREEMKIWVGELYCVGNFCGRGSKQIFDYLAESSLILPVGKTLNLSWFKFGDFPFLILSSKTLTFMLAVLHNPQHFCLVYASSCVWYLEYESLIMLTWFCLVSLTYIHFIKTVYPS